MTPRCVVYHIELAPHPTNPKLRVGKLGPHQVVVGDHYDQHTLGVHLPPGALVPDDVAEAMWVKGKLAGAQKNRVKARAIGGVPSEGLFYGSQYFIDWNDTEESGQRVDAPHWNAAWREGDDVTDALGVRFKEE